MGPFFGVAPKNVARVFKIKNRVCNNRFAHILLNYNLYILNSYHMGKYGSVSQINQMQKQGLVYEILNI